MGSPGKVVLTARARRRLVARGRREASQLVLPAFLLPFEEARALARGQSFGSPEAFRAWALSGAAPPDLPLFPEWAYAGTTGWQG